MRPQDLVRVLRVVEESGWPPACECGCHEPTRFVLHGPGGRPGGARFVNRAHQAWVMLAPLVDLSNISKQEGRRGQYLPVEDVAAALRRFKKAKGWTVEQMAAACGLSYGHMNGLLYSQRKHRNGTRQWVSKALVEQILRRAQGAKAKPSTYELRTYRQREAAIDRAKNELSEL